MWVFLILDLWVFLIGISISIIDRILYVPPHVPPIHKMGCALLSFPSHIKVTMTYAFFITIWLFEDESPLSLCIFGFSPCYCWSLQTSDTLWYGGSRQQIGFWRTVKARLFGSYLVTFEPETGAEDDVTKRYLVNLNNLVHPSILSRLNT